MMTMMIQRNIELCSANERCGYQAIKLGLMLIESCRGERLGAALALHTLLVIGLPILENINVIYMIMENINSTVFALNTLLMI